MDEKVGYGSVTITNNKGSRAMKKAILLDILYREYKENELIYANYKTLNIKYKLEEKGISNSLFKVLLSELTKEGLLKRVKKGYYKFTEQGIMYVLLGGNHLGVSPPLVMPNNNQKVITDHKKLSNLLKEINLIAVRLHNIKVKVSVNKIDPSKLPKDYIIKEPYFTGQVIFSNETITPTLLLHIQEIKGSDYNDVLIKFFNLFEKIKSILYNKYNLIIGDIINIYQEFAFVFKFPEELENIYKKIIRIATVEGIKVSIDKSTGLWEIESSNPNWIVFFIASPILTFYNANMLMLANARLFDVYETIKQIKSKILNMNMDGETIKKLLDKINMLEAKINTLENALTNFAMQIETHLGVMKGIWGMLESLTVIKNQEVFLLKNLSDTLEKLSEKLDKIK